jgi:hypothetical protein
MEELSDIFDSIINFVLGNIGIVIFALFLLSGLIGRGNRRDQNPNQPQEQRTRPTGQPDNRPLAERMAEYLGAEVPDEEPRRDSRRQTYGSEGRRSPVSRNVQSQYPELFGGAGMFDRRADREEDTRWGFDESEWGSTFVKNDEQWGHTFPDRKDSEPRIERSN